MRELWKPRKFITMTLTLHYIMYYPESTFIDFFNWMKIYEAFELSKHLMWKKNIMIYSIKSIILTSQRVRRSEYKFPIFPVPLSSILQLRNQISSARPQECSQANCWCLMLLNLWVDRSCGASIWSGKFSVSLANLAERQQRPGLNLKFCRSWLPC